MDCPECGAPLVTYRLDGREAPVCEACGHVGIDAEHRPARLRVESWGEALRRFYGSDDVSVPVDAGMTEPDRTQPETWAAALERFYRDADRDGRQEPTADAASEAQPEPATVAFEGRPAVRRNESG